MAIDPSDEAYGDWLPSAEEVFDEASPERFARLTASLGTETPTLGPGTPLPVLWHWFMFLQKTPRERTGEDGHPQRGGFLPPLPQKRRMFVGGRVAVESPALIGSRVRRTGSVVSVEEKTGRSGNFVLVTVRYEISDSRRMLVTEEQDLIYTDAPPKSPDASSAGFPPKAPWTAEVTPDEVLLFRFSALTFNSHRIHYDRGYALSEGYPDVVTHGPLTAVLLADLVRTHEARPVSRFVFRARAPLYVGETIRLNGYPEGNTVQLTAHRPEGTVAFEAEAALT